MALPSAGFSLLELLMVVALTGLLAFMGTSLMDGWNSNTYQLQAQSILHEGVSRARSVALRNPDGVKGESNAAAALCLYGTQLQLEHIKDSGSPNTNLCTGALNSNDSRLVWQATLPNSIVVKDRQVESLFQCLALDNQGILIADDLEDAKCSMDTAKPAAQPSLWVCSCSESQKSQHASLCPSDGSLVQHCTGADLF